MQIEERSAGDVIVLDLKGKMTLGEGDELLKDKINSLVQQGRRLPAPDADRRNEHEHVGSACARAVLGEARADWQHVQRLRIH